jgi:hypothetical protein
MATLAPRIVEKPVLQRYLDLAADEGDALIGTGRGEREIEFAHR